MRRLGFANGVNGGPGWQRIGLVLVVLAAFLLRLYRLGADSIWYDESVSLFLASKSVPDMVAHTAGDIHPPLYYALLHLWMGLTGSSEYAAAYLSLVFGVLLVPLTYVLGRRLLNPATGFVAAVLVAVSPFHLWYSQELRMYTLGACLGVVALLALWDALETSRGGMQAWVIYFLAATAGMYTLYYFAFALLALNVWALWAIGHRGAKERILLLHRWAGMHAGAVLAYGPWLPIAWRQATDPPVPPWRTATPLWEVAAESWSALSFGQSAAAGQVWPLLLITLVLAVMGAWRLARRGASHVLLAVGSILIPIGAIAIISFAVPLYHTRYVFTYSPAFYVLLAAGIWEILGTPLRGLPKSHWLTVALAVLLVAPLGAGIGLSLQQYHGDPRYAADDHRSAVRFLEEQWRPGDAVLINAGYVYPSVLYYNGLPLAWRGRLTDYGTAFRREDDPQGLVLLQAGSVDGPADLGWGSPDSDFFAMSWDETRQALERVFADYKRVWIYRCYDTVTDPEGRIRAWLDEHGIKFEETLAFAGLSNLRIQGYLTSTDLATSPPASARSLGTLFGGRLELAAVEGVPAIVYAGNPVDLTLWWRGTEPLPRLATSVRLVDGTGQTWAQWDGVPLGSLFDTTRWPTGSLVRQPVRLQVPTGLIPGTHRLVVGVYEADSGIPWLTATRDDLEIVGVSRSGGEVMDEPWATPLASFGERIDLLSAVASEEEILAGRELSVTLEWWARQAVEQDLVVFLQLVDRAGKLLAAQEGPPANGAYPTSRWEENLVVRDARGLQIPADTPPGRHDLIVGWYDPNDHERLAVPAAWPRKTRDYYRIDKVKVTSRTPQLDPPFEPARPVGAPMGGGIEFVGYDLDASAARPGGSVSLKLLWRRVAPIGADYAVFCHLVDEDGQIWGQSDGVPAGGTMPTLSWMSDEYVADQHQVSIRPDAPAGAYRLLVGLYDPTTHDRPGEPINLGAITVRP